MDPGSHAKGRAVSKGEIVCRGEQHPTDGGRWGMGRRGGLAKKSAHVQSICTQFFAIPLQDKAPPKVQKTPNQARIDDVIKPGTG